MPFQNYQELVSEIDDLLGRGDLRTKIQGWIDLAQHEIVQDCRDLQDVIFITSGSMVGGVNTLALPTDYTSIEVLQIDSNPITTVLPLSIPELKAKQATLNSGGRPLWYARTGNQQIEMAPNPDADHAYTIYYKGMYPETTESSTTSQLLAQAPDLLMYGAAKHSSPFTRDDRGGEWEGIFQSRLKKYKRYLSRTNRKVVQASNYGTTINDGPPGIYF